MNNIAKKFPGMIIPCHTILVETTFLPNMDSNPLSLGAALPA